MDEYVGPDLAIRRRNLPHWQAGGRCYYVTCCALRPLSEAARSIVLEVATTHHQEFYWLHAIVVMPDHCHMLLRPLAFEKDRYYSLGKIMGRIKGKSALEINRSDSCQGSLWLHDNFDRLIRGPLEFNEKLMYIRRNPVEAGLVADPEAYPYLRENILDP